MTITAAGNRALVVASAVLVLAILSGCDWRGVNSLPLPGTAGQGPGSFQIQAQLPDVSTIQQNSRVRVDDVTVGNVTKIERQGWHALVTMRLNGDVELPANAIAKVGQTSLLGSMHIELMPPTGSEPVGRLHQGSVIALSSGGAYPTTEQTLSALSLLLNGGGVGQIQDITQTLSTAFAGREADLRSLLQQLDEFTAHVNNQTEDILAASRSLNTLVGKFAGQQPVLDNALRKIPDALAVLSEQRTHLADALDLLGQFSALLTSAVGKTKENIVQVLKDIGPVLDSLANAGPALTQSLNILASYPWPKDTLDKWFRGDYANVTAVIDLTLSRLDANFFTGTRWEGDLTELEMQWGRTIGQMPSPYTATNPLVVPYQHNQGP